jgi:hypothetical protein
MRSLAWFLLLVGTAAFAFEVKRVTVAQLEQEVNALQGEPDSRAAQKLTDLQLTERLSAAKFAQLDRMHGRLFLYLPTHRPSSIFPLPKFRRRLRRISPRSAAF